MIWHSCNAANSQQFRKNVCCCSYLLRFTTKNCANRLMLHLRVAVIGRCFEHRTILQWLVAVNGRIVLKNEWYWVQSLLGAADKFYKWSMLHLRVAENGQAIKSNNEWFWNCVLPNILTNLWLAIYVLLETLENLETLLMCNVIVLIGWHERPKLLQQLMISTMFVAVHGKHF